MTPPAFDPMQLAPSQNGDSLLGTMIGNYAIEALLGKGGFGAVYRARDVNLDRDVALKFLKDPLEAENRALFEKEAKAVAALGKHRAIVQVHEWGEHHKYLYFVMDFATTSADKLLHDNPDGLPISRAMEIVRQALEGLAYAHDQGYMHRDIKPENLLVDDEINQVKLADFGLVSVCDNLQASILAGRISGSPPYMSPEQASGHPLDNRSDLYSMGVTLYRLLSGATPVESEKASEIMQGIRNDDRVPLRDRRPDLPEAILALVDKATAFKPEDRFQHAQAMGQAIEALQEDLPDEDTGMDETLLSPHTTKMRMKKPFPYTLAGGLAAAAIALIVVAFTFLKTQTRPKTT
jgi:serine/threonine-protein kinase